MHVVTSERVVLCDVEVDQGKIVSIKKDIPGTGTDFQGKYVLPSIIDLHVHARDFNQKYKETVKTCTEAAVAGGVTTVVDMPNTDPAVVTQKMFERRKKLFEQNAVCGFALNIGVVGTLKEIQKVDPLFVKVYLAETTGRLLFTGDAESLMGLRVPVAIHSDLETTKKWCALNKNVLYVCHIASKPEIEYLHALPVIKEVTPHHLFLTGDNDPLKAVKPPLGTKEDRNALWAHFDSIDVVASDHAPHTYQEKMEGASGIAGIETMLPLLLNAYNKGMVTLQDIALKVSENPSRLLNTLLGFQKGFFVGADADFTVLDVKKEWVINSSRFYSKADHSPFDGWKIKGRVDKTIVKGSVVYEQ